MKHIVLLFWLLGCASLDSNESKAPPRITADLSVETLLSLGVEHGDVTLTRVKNMITKKRAWIQAGKILSRDLLNHYDRWPSVRMVNMVHLFQTKSQVDAPKVFSTLVRSQRALVRQLAWQIAAQHTSKKMVKSIENHLTQAIVDDLMQEILLPEMAKAVASNRMIDSYTIVRQGLFEKGNIAFAKAMASLRPDEASHDFVDYLAVAPVEELRQLNMTSVDVLVCVEILQHLLVRPVAVNHPKFKHLFFFSISRNIAMAEMARAVLEPYMSRHAPHMAFMLTTLPTWIQIAYVENLKRKMSPQISYFFSELKKVSPQKEVIEEMQVLR